MPNLTTCCLEPGGYCARSDSMFNLAGIHVVDVGWHDDHLMVTVETGLELVGCPACGVVAVGHGRRVRRLHDIPAFGSVVEVVWRKRTWRCAEPLCPNGVFSEADSLARPRAKLTIRAAWWALGQVQDGLSVLAVARRLDVDWHTLWDAVEPLLDELADDPTRYRGVEVLGVDEHIWHHSPRAGKGPRELTGMVDLTRDGDGRTHARLLDLVPGRSGTAYATWLRDRGDEFTAGVQVATLDPFRGYANAIDNELEDAVAVLDAFHVVRLGLNAMEETRRRVQQDQLGHRGHRDDPLYRIRNALRAGTENLSPRQLARIDAGLADGDPSFEVTVAWHCYQRLRSAFHTTLTTGRQIALHVLDTFASCPIPEIARLGRTLQAWRHQFLAYFSTDRSSNGGTEAINGIIELHRRIARGFRNPHHYRLRMLLAAGHLIHPNLR